MKKLGLVIAVLIFAVSVTTSSASATSLPVGSTGCTVYANPMAYVQAPNTYEGIGALHCAHNANMQIQVCLTQLLTNGWQRIDWSCAGPGNEYSCGFGVTAQCGRFDNFPSHWVGLTRGRWYRSSVWAYVNGQAQSVQGDGHQG